MTGRELDVPPASTSLSPLPLSSSFAADVTGHVRLITPPNWTAVIFLLCLGFLHLCIAIPAFVHLRWEGYMSATLACAFITGSGVAYRSKSEIIFDSGRRRIRIRSGVWRFYFQRWIGFDEVHAVRLTFSPKERPRSRIEVLCDNEDIECPPTKLPRQEALCLAMLLNVQLIKVWADSPGFEAEHSARV
jgi:hypothetical protein